MSIQANTVKVRYAYVTLSDLPAEFNGTRLLYLSDIDLCGTHDRSWMKALLRDISRDLSPDILVISGDIFSKTPLERLNTAGKKADPVELSECLKLFDCFDAPLGKYLISGSTESAPEAMAMLTVGSGFKQIDLKPEIITRQKASIAITGITDGAANASKLSQQVTSDKCVIAVMNSPKDLGIVRTGEASNGGSWVDLILAGDTYGGLINIMGESILGLSDWEANYRAGWFTDGSQPVLVSQGVGTDGWGLRWNSDSELWLITLSNSTTTELPISSENSDGFSLTLE